MNNERVRISNKPGENLSYSSLLTSKERKAQRQNARETGANGKNKMAQFNKRDGAG